jgi:hypothetical protein
MPEDLETINKSELPFADLLPQVAEEIPHIVEVLQRAQNNRTKVLNAKARGVRLAGLNQWLGYLKELEAAFLDPRLEPLRFLMVRIRMNYDAAIEATLTGMPSVVNDSMRDVMEIELLLQDFAATPANVQRWLAADEKLVMDEFAPKHLRRRKASRLGIQPKDLSDTQYYKGHSRALHVQPRSYPHERRGLVEMGHPIFDDFLFWELLGHALQLCETLESLVNSLAPGLTISTDILTRLGKVGEGYKRVREWNQIMGALVEAHRESGAAVSDEE